MDWDDPKILQADASLTRLLSFFPRVDTKFSVILAIALAIVASLGNMVAKVECLGWSLALSLGLSGLLIVGCLWQIYKGTFPDLEGPKDSVIYFSAIADLKLEKFQGLMNNLTPSNYHRDLVNQCHRNSQILKYKFDRLKSSYQLLLWTLIPYLISLWLFEKAVP